jgi:TDG/mug DNA glycosylase family protein
VLGLQDERLVDSAFWVLPSPSGLNANHQLADLVALLRALREWVDG